MARNRSRIQPSNAPSGPMYVVAGLPLENHTGAMNYLKTVRPTATVVGAPSSSQDGTLYPDRLAMTLLRTVAGFAVRRRTKGPSLVIAPRSITLLYVPSSDQERLLKAFDFTVLAGALTPLAAFGESGRQLRHERKAVEETLRDAVGATGRPKLALDEVSQRIGRLSDREALLLPPQNYTLATGPFAWISQTREVHRG